MISNEVTEINERRQRALLPLLTPNGARYFNSLGLGDQLLLSEFAVADERHMRWCLDHLDKQGCRLR